MLYIHVHMFSQTVILNDFRGPLAFHLVQPAGPSSYFLD